MNDAEQEPLWQPGNIIEGRYEVIRLAGRGGMGWVYQVKHLEWGIDLAVKQPRPDVVLTSRVREQFVEEAETWVSLGLHPNLCCCHYVRQLGGLPMVFAEYVPGGSLRNWITDGRLYEGQADDVLRRVLDVAIQFAWGLEHAHQRSMVHQDVKPDNVLLDTRDGNISVKVTDFGLARARPGIPLTTSEPGADGGEVASIQVSRAGLTLAYASPEQTRGAVLNRHTDVYSYAVSVLEMFTGNRLWQRGDKAGQALSAYLAGAAAKPGIPPMPAALAALLQRCLHEKPEDPRPKSMAGIAAEIAAIYQSAVHSAYPRTMPRAAGLRADELNNRALSLLDLGQIAEAEETFAAAQEADPRHLEATYNDGLRQWRSGAIADDVLISKLEAARTASGDSWLARYLLAEVHLERGDLAAAHELLRTVEHIAPKQPNVANALRTVRSGRLTDARCVKTRTMSWWPEYERWVTEADGRKAKYAPRTKIRFTADGQRALVASMNHVGLWDIHSGQCLFRRDEPHYYKKIDVSADGRFALCGLDTEVQMWDLTHGRELWRVAMREDAPSGTRYIGMRESASAPVAAVWLSADARIAATQSGGGSVMIWDARTGRLRLRLGRPGKLYGLSPDGRFALIRHDDDTMQLWDASTGVCRWELRGVNGAVPASISADSRTVAIASSCETRARTWENIGIWDLSTAREIRTLTGHTHRVTSLSWSGDSRLLLSGGNDGTARLWELDSGRCLRTFSSTTSWEQEVLLEPDSRHAVAADEDMVRWWTLPSRHTAPPQLSRPRQHGELTRLDADVTALVDAAEEAIEACRYSEAHELLSRARETRGYERAPHVLSAWRALAGVFPRAGVRASWQVGEFPGLSISPCAVDLSPDGARVVSGGKTLRVYDTSTGHCLREWDTSTGHSKREIDNRPYPLTAVRLSPDQQRVLSATQNGEICLWSIDTGDCLMKITNQHPRGGAQPAYFSADGRWALTGDSDNAIHLWDLDNGRCTRTVPGHGRNGFIVTDVWLSPDGRRAVSGGTDRTVRVWDMDTGECMHILADHTDWVRSVSLSPDGGFVLSSGSDRTIRLWDLVSGACVHVQRDLPGDAQTVRYVCDGRFVMAVTPGRPTSVIQVWDPRTGRFLHTLDTRQSGIWASAFTPDGRFALTAGEGTPLRLWELDWELATSST
ncbi:protein kinase [Nocardia sp. NBC_00881]|uniref:WD40 repeat domain-containing serine/threonine protein kinase n=1 Tax=Nocardia sp. NBC_00881 TaxID=2975995 RepID=UPI003863C4A9|nr:protein kinase [Nocardia sp. NBC_00881]